VIALQALVRRNLDKDGEKAVSEEDIIKTVSEWKPSVARIIGANQKEALFNKIDKLSDEDRKALIAKLLGNTEEAEG
jgi:methionine salvage enolase-phosphatase E1